MRFFKLRDPKKLTGERFEKAFKSDIQAVLNKYDGGGTDSIMVMEVLCNEVFADLNDEFERRFK